MLVHLPSIWPSGVPAIIVVIFDMSAPEHDIIFAEAGLTAKTEAMRAAQTIAYFIVNSMRRKAAQLAAHIGKNCLGDSFQAAQDFGQRGL